MADILQYLAGLEKTAGHVYGVFTDADGHNYVDFAALTAGMLPTHVLGGAVHSGDLVYTQLDSIVGAAV